MAQIALPRHQATQSQSAEIGSPLYRRRQPSTAGPVDLLPNPDFSFPMKSADAPNTGVASPLAYPAGRRGSLPHQRQQSKSALPSFSFNPSAAAQPSSMPSPPQSPEILPTTPSRPIHGHRRGGSEFIGGDPRASGMSLLSSSPTKPEMSMSLPTSTLRPGPPAGRRGHAHRRSGAVSSHDLSSIMNPPSSAKAGSAPVTPLEGNEFKFGHSVNKSISQPSLRGNATEDEFGVRPPSRARVGFSDRIEYIRPLSTISSETETSMSTARGHSASNSLSSVIGSSSPQPTRSARSSLSFVDGEDSRPSTAGAVLDKLASSPLSGTIPDLKRPMSAISPTSPSASSSSTRCPAKKRGFFRLESRRSDTAVPTLSTSTSDPSLSKTAESPLASPAVEDDESAEETEKSKSGSRKSNRKPRKVKSWANSIIPRKGKSSKKLKERSSTPPPDSVPDMDDTDASDDLDFEPNFDVDTTVTIVSPTEGPASAPRLDTDYTSWQPRQLKRVDSDIMSPIIDLDAALGPFNTPNGSSPRNQQRGFAAHRRAMHSANGPAASHRRTESAPELVPFEHRPSTVSATSPMADVFEEEEPEEEPVAVRKNSKHSLSTPKEVEEPQIEVVETDVPQQTNQMNWNFNDALGIRGSKRPISAIAPTTKSLHTSADVDKPSSAMEPIEVVEDYEEPRTSSLTHSSDSTITQHSPIDPPKDNRTGMNLTLPLPHNTLMTPETVTSAFSSPDFRSSRLSTDTPRLGTAASSMTDYPVMPSPRFGEPGPELRVSVDDVPSLTSSRSTMTSALHNVYPLPSPRRIGDRSASLCSASSALEARRSKRASIVSFSRLISGEKSSLSQEQRPQSAYVEQPKDKKKNKRLSKLMFWKAKDTSSLRG